MPCSNRNVRTAFLFNVESHKVGTMRWTFPPLEAMRAAWILKQDFGYQTRVINMHTLKPIDEAAIVRAAKETGVVLTAEEHQINGGLGGAVAEVVVRNY